MTPQDIVVTPWEVRFFGCRFPVSVGKGGLTENKQEGDGATPVGEHHIVGCLWRADRMARPCSWATPIGPGDLWSDDKNDPCYNNQVKAPHPFSHERLMRSDPLYDVILITDWNWPNALPGKGSAIFVHTWRGPRMPTEGCVAFRRDHLLWIISRIEPGSKLIVKA